jgi:hypothetical protein
MCKSLRIVAAVIVSMIIFASINLAGCSSDVSQSQSSSSGQQPSTSSGQQSIDQSMQQQPPDSSGQGQFPGASNMTEILNRAAEILGISSDDFITAFNNAMSEGGAFDSGQQGQPSPPSGQQEGQQPPAPPSGQQEGQQPPAPPSDQQQGQQPTPPQGQQMSQSQFMTEVYAKMAVELNISADDIAEAMVQAETELQE